MIAKRALTPALTRHPYRLLDEPLAVGNRFVVVPRGLGLGSTVDEDLLRRYQV